MKTPMALIKLKESSKRLMKTLKIRRVTRLPIRPRWMVMIVFRTLNSWATALLVLTERRIVTPMMTMATESAAAPDRSAAARKILIVIVIVIVIARSVVTKTMEKMATARKIVIDEETAAKSAMTTVTVIANAKADTVQRGEIDHRIVLDLKARKHCRYCCKSQTQLEKLLRE